MGAVTLLRRVLPPLAALLLAGAALADVLVLADGRRIEGTIVAETRADVTIDTPFGTFTFARDEVVSIERKRTRDQEYEERLAACETADDFHALGLWCEENKLRRRAEGHYRRALELDPDHAGARAKLGFVRYRGEWMTPEERDRRREADLAAEMRAKGLVRHGDRWVTPEEREKLARGLVLHEGVWVPEAEAMASRGLAEYGGEWIAFEVAHARRAADGFAGAAGRPVPSHVGAEAVVIGTLPPAVLAEIAVGAARGRAWFDGTWDAPPGHERNGGRLPELYVFGEPDLGLYARSIAWLRGRSRFVPDGWEEAVGRTHGFTWIDPAPVSSVRRWNRDTRDAVGHCYHNLGHLLAGRLGYDGRLLPPWYEEAVAVLCELRVSEEARVFCRASLAPTFGSSSGMEEADLDAEVMRDGSWRQALVERIRRGSVRPFDELARLEFSQLGLLDVAQAVAIVAWLEERGDGALARFHAALRAAAPPAPERVLRAGHERHAAYDAAFRAACGMGFREADSAWRAWWLSR